MANYRVEKDGRTRHISPELVPYYKSLGYRIFKPLELEITDDDDEIENALSVDSADLAERIETTNETI